MKKLSDIIKERYHTPHKFSLITLEDFCEINEINEEELTKSQIDYFYDNYGKKWGLPASHYDRTHDHNDWICEMLQSHDYNVVIRRIKGLLKDYVLDVDVEETSEKHKDSRIIKFTIDKSCDIFDNHKFKLNDSELSDNIYDIINFHNYYITLINIGKESNELILEPKYTENVTKEVKNNKYIYHITSKKNLTNILKKGLRPRAKKSNDIYRYFVERVFFVMHGNDATKDVESVINDLGYKIWSDEYVILKVDVSNLNITFWCDDASTGNTIYTYDSIHPKFITVINDIKEI